MFDRDALRENHYDVTYLLGRFMTEHLVRLYEAFDGDLTAAIVLGTIGQYNYRRYFDQLDAGAGERLSTLAEEDRHLPHARPCNAMSVSQSTGIPRETVRRKIRKLLDKGWLRQIGPDKLVITRLPGRHFAAFDRDTMERFASTAESIRRVVEKK
jgi:hypothetical protein